MTPILAALLGSLSTSPWSPAEWRLNLNIGRQPGTYMPEEWGASGAQLLLPLELLIESDRATTRDVEKDFMGGGSFQLKVLEDPSFISAKGEEVVYFEELGAWKIGARRGKVGDASRIRFWVDVSQDCPDGIAATRNDVTLPAERLYFVANCWREDEIKAGQERYLPIKANADESQQIVDQQLSHESGDRRLDGANPLDTAMASIDMAVLVARRDESAQKLKEADRILPNPALEFSDAGFWPGSTEKLIVAPGTICVKRRSAGLFGNEEFHIVGTWSAKPLIGVKESVDRNMQS